ncbi:MAG TPA: class I SAM-dependent methyltransferase [Acidimicrobiales bacterium]|nr:class I SAM-dependent methyltransferase [Acidimicrobiales bacterium]
MDRDDWNARYSGPELLWKAEPNRFLVEEIADLQPGRALDVACGEGRNAVWLADRGWQVTGVDFSDVALSKARRLADDRGVSVEWVNADVAGWDPPADAFDLVILFYLQLPEAERHQVYGRMARGLAPGGTFLAVGHDRENLTAGYGGPQDPQFLFSAEDVVGDLPGLKIVKAEQVRRPVDTDDGVRTALDALVRAVRP